MKIGTLGTIGTALILFCIGGRVSAQATKTPPNKATASPSALRKEAKITESEARKTALAQVPGGKVQSHELERENGKLIYSYDIKVAGKPGVEEVNVDAVTGQVVAHQHEDAKAEAKEKKSEARAKKKP
jgi:hypothetical protein